MSQIAIIGGGPAGLMAAATLIEHEVDVDIVIYEKSSDLGKKLLVTGGGRCNLTTSLNNPNQILSNYPRGREFLSHSLQKFSPKQVRVWFKDHGVETVIEDNYKVYPRSGKSVDVLNVFKDIYAKAGNVEVRCNTEVGSVRLTEEEKFEIDAGDDVETFDYLVIATGGQKNQEGSGYALAKSLGHSIKKLSPALSSFEVKDGWCKNLSGLSFSEARIVYYIDGKQQKVEGSILFTHFGISGPVVFSLSSLIAYEEINDFSIKILIDKTKDFQKWDKILLDAINQNSSQSIKNILSKFVPQRFVVEILGLAGINERLKGAEVSKKHRRAISRLLGEGIEVSLAGRKQGEEMVTAGGVSTDEVDPESCESKLVPGLFFAGEVLDVDGFTGGFNLQACWGMGRIVRESITSLIR